MLDRILTAYFLFLFFLVGYGVSDLHHTRPKKKQPNHEKILVHPESIRNLLDGVETLHQLIPKECQKEHNYLQGIAEIFRREMPQHSLFGGEWDPSSMQAKE